MGSITQPNDNKLLLFFKLQICGLKYLRAEIKMLKWICRH